MFRPLPALDDTNSFFWTSGRDHHLRFLRCQSCGYYLHPPIPRCPQCGSRDVAPESVTGRGTVVTCTVNYQPWDGDPTPYVLAIVELAEQPGLRLTTNIVECPPEAVAIGQAVEVLFEQHDEVWIPLFRPAPAWRAS